MTAYAAAHENAVKMRQLHDKLTSDIEALKARKQVIKSKVAIAKTQETINKVSSVSKRSQGAEDKFRKMEEKANRMLDEANAMSELNMEPIDEAKQLEEKYASQGSASVDEELKKLKEEMGI